MVQERRLRVTHTVHTRKNNRLLKTKKGLTNSLSLKQCHFVGQSSILFPKYIYESFQGLYNPDRIRFLSLIRGSYSYGEPDSGCAVSHRLEAQARSSSLMIRMADIKTYPFVFIRSYVFYLKMLQNKKRLLSDLQDLKRSV